MVCNSTQVPEGGWEDTSKTTAGTGHPLTGNGWRLTPIVSVSHQQHWIVGC